MVSGAGLAAIAPELDKLIEEDPRQLVRLLAWNDAGEFCNRVGWIRDFQKGWEGKYRERTIQRGFRELIQSQRYVVGLKSREVGWTWALALLVLWEAWAKGPYQAVYLAQREDNALEFIRRVRWAHKKVVGEYPWLGMPAEVGVETQSRFHLVSGGRESEVLAFPSVPTALESWHPTRVIADQWGLIPGRVLPSALGAIGLTGHFVGLDTAQGAAGEFYDVYTSCRDGYPELFAPEGRRFHHIFASWRDNPDFVNDGGRPSRPSGGTRKDTERMYPENDQEAFSLTAPGEAVFPEFRAEIHISKGPLRAVPGHPLFVGCDFGNTPAAVVFQFGASGQVRVLWELQEMEPGIERFARLLLSEFAQRWPGFEFIWWGDPSGRARRETDGKSCFGILREEFGIVMNAGRPEWTPRREGVAKRLQTLIDGEPGLVVDPSCRLLVQGFLGNYQFPQRRDAADYDAFKVQRERRRAMRDEVGGYL